MALYSQNEEELHIVQYFGKHVGRFLDVGAVDGRQLSNTARLAELGWGGVYVEPSPEPLSGLLANCYHKPQFTVVGAAIASTSKLVTFHNSRGDMISTLSEGHMKHWPAEQYQPLLIKTITWDELISAVGIDFDFVSIDVEGLNAQLFVECPSSLLLRAKCVCVERDHFMDEALMLKAKHHGLRLQYTSPENLLFVR